MDFSGKKIHLVGIKGVGMTALAELLLHYGAQITGSDIAEEFHTDHVLKRLAIKPSNFVANNITHSLDLVIYSSAYSESHPERARAAKLNIPQLSYGETLAEIFNQKRGIMVTGTHGKTTTTALLGHCLSVLGFDPTVVVGGTVINWNSNIRIGNSDWMIVEGDEYQKKFLLFRPDYLLITNIDYDHPDTFPTRELYREAFDELIQKTKQKYFMESKILPNISMGNLIGGHNQKNISLIMKLTRELGIPDYKVSNAIQTFRGVKRRCEVYYTSENLVIIDDYAHHPTEIKTTLEAIKNRYPEYSVKVIFQPHTYSRTEILLQEFATAFKNIDEIILLPTYSSAREMKNINKDVDNLLYQELKKHHSHCVFKSLNIENIEKIAKNQRRTVIITMGAGDVWKLTKRLSNSIIS